MSSLKQKLYDITNTNNKTKSFVNRSKLDYESLARTIDGWVEETPWGQIVIRRKTFPLNYSYAGTIDRFLALTGRDLVYLTKEKNFDQHDPRNFVFMDTETTGLAGGAGTYVFLIGVGYFQGESFFVDQFFLPDYEIEPAFLSAVKDLIQSKKGLITFNGKSYDIPVLRNRYILNRINDGFLSLPHVDLLHVSRRLWRSVIGSCTLQNIEQQQLGFRRENDIPGEQIPQKYFDYLSLRKIEPLIPVFQHNVMDVLSLVAITIKAALIFRQPPKISPKIDYDAMGVVKTLESMGLHQQAGTIADEYSKQFDGKEAFRFMMRKAQNLKKTGAVHVAENAWREVLQSGYFHPLPYIEIAKIHEHKKRDYAAALEYVDKALKSIEILSELGINSEFQKYHMDLQHRRERLKRRIENSRTGNENGKTLS